MTNMREPLIPRGSLMFRCSEAAPVTAVNLWAGAVLGPSEGGQ